MIRLTLLSFLVLLLSGCSIFREDPKLAESRNKAETALDDYKAAIASGDADKIAAAKAALDSAVEDYETLVDELARKYDSLGGWGATAGGVFGPVGAAVGGIAGTLGAGIMGWARTRKLKSFLVGIQAARADLADNQPGALKLMDESMKKAIPKELQEMVRVLKKKGIIGELPS